MALEDKMNDPTFSALIHQIYRTCRNFNERTNRIVSFINDTLTDLTEKDLDIRHNTYKAILLGILYELNSYHYSPINCIRQDLNKLLVDRGNCKLIEDEVNE